MKKLKRFYKALGRNEVGGIDFPSKMSNIQISRIRYGDIQGCSFCFPHGWENSNATQKNYQRNWKRFRKKQWK